MTPISRALLLPILLSIGSTLTAKHCSTRSELKACSAIAKRYFQLEPYGLCWPCAAVHSASSSTSSVFQESWKRLIMFKVGIGMSTDIPRDIPRGIPRGGDPKCTPRAAAVEVITSSAELKPTLLASDNFGLEQTSDKYLIIR